MLTGASIAATAAFAIRPSERDCAAERRLRNGGDSIELSEPSANTWQGCTRWIVDGV